MAKDTDLVMMATPIRFPDEYEIAGDVRQLGPSIWRSDGSGFTDEYVMGSVDAAYLDEPKHVRMKIKAAAVNGPVAIGAKAMADTAAGDSGTCDA
ncbi:hypothetical protein EDB89DRAFT_2076883 [Lactarius sanguifluus]|nr:hypothetical protein EDB89DRAFT_2076883 [Lactarius sanguifluus]